MSEIKGQLLGVILTIAIFGIVATAMTGAFSKAANDIGSQIENVAETSLVTSHS